MRHFWTLRDFEKIRKSGGYVSTIKSARLKVAIEFRYGTGRGYWIPCWQPVRKSTGSTTSWNPLFGGIFGPDEANMKRKPIVRARKSQLGIGLDGEHKLNCGPRTVRDIAEKSSL